MKAPLLPGQRYKAQRLRKEKLDRAKFNRHAVAEAVGMPYSTLADWENGRFRNTAKVPLGVLCRAIGVREQYIMDGSGDPDLPAEDRHVFWGHALTEEAASVGADWLKLLERDPETAAMIAATLRSTVKGLIDAERRGGSTVRDEIPLQRDA